MINRKQPPALKVAHKLHIPEPRNEKLVNNIPVYLFDLGETAITKIDFIFEAGNLHQPAPLLAFYTNKMLTEGTLSYSSFEIAQKLDYYGAWLNKTVSKDHAVVSLSVLNKHLKYVLPVLNEIINHPKFSDDELKTHTRKDKQAFIDDGRKVNEVAGLHFNHQLFGKHHPYGSLTTAADFDRQQAAKLQAFHDQRYTAEKCNVVVSGKLSKDILPLLNYFFGYSKKGKQKSENRASSVICPGKQKQFIEMPSAVQSAIRIGKISINKTHEDFMKLYILNTILGGYFGSRLMKNIREDKGYTYGIYSMMMSFQQAGVFLIASEVGAEVCQRAVDEIYKELKILNTELIVQDELELVKRYMAGSVLRSFDGPYQVADRFKSLLKYGINYKKYYMDFMNTINAVTAEDLLHTSQKYLQESSMLELIVGKAGK
ncbi:MAG TPA: pitrilysin family protein [Bacteroidales bacterium]|nr:insulinase family protein [Bacteroidales bacterium]HNZ43388.1 pitrilysin family protein [Bacteroidales bacterium]HOH83625.1 pitrilysin family protein [Bacteroidales bacterium]HPB24284.1 pitrilysin family protein [Bacteroidales bacterium]HQN14879.1 pitrilysin family protein [Bacteroidales bacterium]